MTNINEVIKKILFPTNGGDPNSIEKKTIYAQTDSDFKTLQISITQIKPVMNILNSQFYNSYYTNLDTAQSYVRPYFEVFQSIMKCFRPIEMALQNPKINIESSVNQYMELFSYFVREYISFFKTVELTNEIYIEIYGNFSIVLSIFLGNIVNQKSTLTREKFIDSLEMINESLNLFSVIIEQQQLKDSITKLKFMFESTPLEYTEELYSSYNSFTSLLNQQTKFEYQQYSTLLDSFNEFRYNLILANITPNFLSLLSQIGCSIISGKQLCKVSKSLKTLLDFFQKNEKIEPFADFSMISSLPELVEMLISYQLKENEFLQRYKILDDELVSFISTWFRPKSTSHSDKLDSVIEYITQKTNTKVIEKVSQFMNKNANSVTENPNENNSSNNNNDNFTNPDAISNINASDKIMDTIPENFDEIILTDPNFETIIFDSNSNFSFDSENNLNSLDPSIENKNTSKISHFETNNLIIESYIFYQKQYEASDKSKNLLYSLISNTTLHQIALIIKTIYLNSESMKGKNDPKLALISDLKKDIHQILSFDGITENSTYFLSLFINALNVLENAKNTIKDTNTFDEIFFKFGQFIPPPDAFKENLNINTRFNNLQHTAGFLIERPLHILDSMKKLLASENSLTDELIDRTAVQVDASDDIINMFIAEVDMCVILLSFLEKLEKLNRMLNVETIAYSKETQYLENDLKASLYLLSLISNSFFSFKLTKEFYLTYLQYIFSLMNDNIPTLDIGQIIPYFDFSELFNTSIYSSLLLEFYSHVIGSEEFVKIVEQIRQISLVTYTKFVNDDDKKLVYLVNESIKSSQDVLSTIHKKINNLGTSIVTSIASFNELFDLVKYLTLSSENRENQNKLTNNINELLGNNSYELSDDLKLEFPVSNNGDINSEITNSNTESNNNKNNRFDSNDERKHYSLLPLALCNYSKCVMKNLYVIAQSDYLNPELSDKMKNAANQLSDILDNTLPNAFSKELENVQVVLIKLINEIRIILKDYAIIDVAKQAEVFFDDILSYYERTPDQTMSSEILKGLSALKIALDDLCTSQKEIISYIAIVRMHIILEKMYQKPDELIPSFDKFNEMINISFSVYLIKKVIFIMLFMYNQTSKQDPALEFLTSEFPEKDNFCEEDDDIDQPFSIIIQNLISTVSDCTDAQFKLKKVVDEGKKNSSQLGIATSNLLSDIRQKISNFGHFADDEEIEALKSECHELINKLEEKEKISQVNFDGLEVKLDMRYLPNTNRIITQLDEENLQIALKNITLDELKKKRDIINQIVEEKEQKFLQTKNNSIPKKRKLQKEKTLEIIEMMKEIAASKSSLKIEYPDLQAQLDELNSENEYLQEQIRILESRHATTQEDEIEMLMTKPSNVFCSYQEIQSNDRENDALKKQINETKESIDRLRKRLSTIKKPLIEETNMIKLLKEIRPREVSETLLDEDFYRNFVKTTKRQASIMMDEWNKLRVMLRSALENEATHS
ncbi:hypothetical protein TRFO_07008 [Tritrichomonas foetus]|uniref:Uncharacterized protein n=1 Tax=Tritrichomonas foetus TaxID=1144522 RepID=A0A1J4JTY7_9EUKA|nr:hypothetical protein TRFO_07008 [Tritrichomonas foetus]|eukprot:OHT02599.1 hypothetical protein TRFO_07008 [Tritrichomonas foetus]